MTLSAVFERGVTCLPCHRAKPLQHPNDLLKQAYVWRYAAGGKRAFLFFDDTSVSIMYEDDTIKTMKFVDAKTQATKELFILDGFVTADATGMLTFAAVDCICFNAIKAVNRCISVRNELVRAFVCMLPGIKRSKDANDTLKTAYNIEDTTTTLEGMQLLRVTCKRLYPMKSLESLRGCPPDALVFSRLRSSYLEQDSLLKWSSANELKSKNITAQFLVKTAADAAELSIVAGIANSDPIRVRRGQFALLSTPLFVQLPLVFSYCDDDRMQDGTTVLAEFDGSQWQFIQRLAPAMPTRIKELVRRYTAANATAIRFGDLLV